MKTNHAPIQPPTPTIFAPFKRHHVFALALLLCLGAFAPAVHAAALTWDTSIAADATITAGSGTWQAGSGNWNNGITSVGINWNNSPADSATFGGADGGPYIITVGGNITNNGLTFANSGYLLRAASAQFVTNGTAGTISIASGKTATISTNVTLTRTIAISGGGTLIVTNAGAVLQGAGTPAISGNLTKVIVGTGGSFTAQSSIIVGNTGAVNETNTLEVTGGSVDLSTGSGANLIIYNGSSGSGTITLSSGSIVNNLISGSLRFGLGSLSGGSVSSTFNLNGGTLTVPRIIKGNANCNSVFNFNGGTLKVLSTSTVLANFMSSIDTANVRNGGAIIDPNGVSSTNGQSFVHSTIGGDAAIDGGLTINDSAATKGTMTFTNASTYTGPTTIQAGTMALSTAATLGATTAPLNLSGGALQLGGLSQTVGAVSITAIPASGSTISGGSLTGTSYIASHASGNAIVSANLLGSSVNLTNSGAGILTLSGANTYSGNTYINAGTLNVGNGSAAGSLGTGNVINSGSLVFNRSDSTTVNNIISGAGEVVKLGAGTLTLTNVNTYTGNTTVSNGTLNVSTRATGSGGYIVRDARTLGVTLHASGASLQISSLTLGASSPKLAFDVATFGNPAVPVVTNTGNLSLNGNVIVDVTGTGFTAAPATNILFAYTGTRSGSGVFVAGTLPTIGSGYSASIVDDTVNKQVQLVINTTPNSLIWTAGTATWDITALNWQTNSSVVPNSTNFNQGDLVRIDDTPAGSGPFTITVGLDVAPASLTISNATKDYTLSGSSAITGTSTLVKDGAAQLTVLNNNTYVNTTIISNGLVQVGNGGTSGTLGSGNIVMANSSRLVYNRSDAITIASAISGSGSLTNLGSGTTTLTGASTYTGATAVPGGALQLDGGNNRLPTTTTVTLGDGASGSTKLILGGSTAVTQTLAGLTNSGSGTANAVVGGNAADSTLTLSVAANTTNFSIALGGSGVNETNLAFTKATSGTVLILNQANTYNGLTTVSAGGLIVSNNLALGTTNGATTVASSGTLALSGGVSIAENFNITGPGSGAIAGSEVAVLQRGAIQSSSGSNYISGNITITAGTNTTRIGCQEGAHLQLAGTITTNGIGTGLIFRNGNNSGITLVSGTGNNWGDTAIYGGVTRLGVNNGLSTNGRLTIGTSGLGDSTFDLNGFNQTVVNIDNGGTIPGITNSQAGQSVLTINNTETNRTYTGYIHGNIALVKSGSFKQTLATNNLYTGNTTINAGALALSSNGFITNSPVITVASGAIFEVNANYALIASQTLRGEGTVSNRSTINGTVAPGLTTGSTIGTLTFSTNAILAGTATLDVNSANAQTADKLVVATGTLTYGGTLTVANPGPIPTSPTVFDLFDAPVFAGNFSSITLPSGGSLHWRTNGLTVDGTITFTNTVPTAASPTYTRTANTQYIIPIASLVSDLDGDTLTFIGDITNNISGLTNLVDATNIYVPTNNVNDSFTYTVRDNFGGTNTGTVTININGNVFGQGSPSISTGGGNPTVSFAVIQGLNYTIQRAEDVNFTVGLTNIRTMTATSNGLYQYTDATNAPLPNPSAYYRLRYNP